MVKNTRGLLSTFYKYLILGLRVALHSPKNFLLIVSDALGGLKGGRKALQLTSLLWKMCYESYAQVNRPNNLDPGATLRSSYGFPLDESRGA